MLVKFQLSCLIRPLPACGCVINKGRVYTCEECSLYCLFHSLLPGVGLLWGGGVYISGDCLLPVPFSAAWGGTAFVPSLLDCSTE